MTVNFSDLKLHPYLEKNIASCNFSSCTDIQVRSFEPIVSGKDVAGLAQTGTGKTFAFVVPLMERFLRSEEENHPRRFENLSPHHWNLILVPTRELGEQVHEQVKILDKSDQLGSALILGGLPYERQKEELKKKPRFVVATPGRLNDLVQDNCVQLSQVKSIVFDEADRLFDMGFQPQIRNILERVPKDRQLLIYSATLNFEVLQLAYEFAAHPIEINTSQDALKAHNVTDCIYHVGHNDKPQYLISLLKKHKKPTAQALVFTNFKHNVERLSHYLNINNFPAQGLSSLLNQKQRSHIMANFKTHKNYSILVATDVAARGLDIKGIDLVINYELPDFSETYVHRIGRTGRADARGVAFSLVGDKDLDALERIEKFLNTSLPIEWLNDEDLVSSEKLKPFPYKAPSEKVRLNKVSDPKARNRRQRKNDRRRTPREESKTSQASSKKKPYQRSFQKKNAKDINFQNKKSGYKKRPKKTSAKKQFNKKRYRSGSSHKKQASFSKKRPLSFLKKITRLFKT